MPRYLPSEQEQAAIDLLHLAGYTTLRQASYDRLLERVRIAEALRDAEVDRREGTTLWAHEALVEQRRLSNRLNEVCFAAAALGVPIDKIQEALDKGSQPKFLHAAVMIGSLDPREFVLCKHPNSTHDGPCETKEIQ